MLPVWKEEIPAHSFDVDCKNQLRISNLCSFFQETAGHHASHLGVGFDHLRQSGLAWVLSRLEISFLRLPVWGDIISIETWPTGNERLYFRREFSVTGRNGEKLVTAVSYWLLISLQSRRPKMLTLPIDVIRENTGRYAMQPMQDDIPSLPYTPGESALVHVAYSDIDVNMHVNNARYAAWIGDLFPVDFHARYEPEFFRIDIRQEIRANETVQISKSGNNMEYILEGRNNQNLKTCFQSIIRFCEMHNP